MHLFYGSQIINNTAHFFGLKKSQVYVVYIDSLSRVNVILGFLSELKNRTKCIAK